MSAFLDYVLLSLLFVAGFAAVAFLAMGVGYRRGRRDEAALVAMREVRMVARFDEGRRR